MPTQYADSLLDEAEFLAELSTLDDGLSVKRRDDEPIADVTTPVRTRPPGKFKDEPPRPRRLRVPAPRAAAAMSGGMSALVLVLMFCAGAAAAALVFHEQVWRILLRIQ